MFLLYVCVCKASAHKSLFKAKFGNITEFQKGLGGKFLFWYNEVFQDSALTDKGESLIALSVAHAVQCPYCIDAYSSDAYENG